MTIKRFYLKDALDERKVLKDLSQVSSNIISLKIERCYHIELENNVQLNKRTEAILRWLLKCTQQSDTLTEVSSLPLESKDSVIIEIGPRFNFSTPYSTNCVNICHNIGLKQIKRIETSIRYYIIFKSLPNNYENIINALSDRMTECCYTSDNLPMNSFDEQLPKIQDPWYDVPIDKIGRKALEDVNEKLGLAFGDWDLDFYLNLFKNVLKRNPTTVELFDCAQSNSEHSRHWFFKGRMIVDGILKSKSLIEMIADTQKTTNSNNTIKFSDNSSAIRGYKVKTLQPVNSSAPGCIRSTLIECDLIFTAETHNMPTAVAPFSGATTGTGGRIRDVQGVGRGGLPIAGTAGYCVGNLNMPGYSQQYENMLNNYPPSFASPLKILIEASNGASDYGNKFGEPVISGFAISYGLPNALNERCEYVKPIMFSGGLGVMDATMRKKIDPSKGMLLAKIGGPVYRIGVGGGAASSIEVQGDNSLDLDFNAVQRGDAEMENKLNRVVRACIEMGEKNPILAIHDQGAGGNGNVLKELVEPGYAGAVLFTKEFQLGDPTITTLELWGAEYQENNAIICKPEDQKILQDICNRERCPISFVGIVSGNGYVTLIESEKDFDKYSDRSKMHEWGPLPFDMHLKDVLGDMPSREYKLNHLPNKLVPLTFPNIIDNNDILKGVLSIMTVGSKRFLTSKVDRCVTGLIAQQQCVGPLHTPLADYAIVAVSHLDIKGIATSIGTQPIKGLLSAKCGGRMSVAEAISNLVFAGISELADVKCSGNWMWAAKCPGEGAKLYDACKAMCEIMSELNIAVDGGKDSLSMAARVEHETVKSPGTLVVSTYVPCPDIRIKITPNLKCPSSGREGQLIWVNIESTFRLGGSALAQFFGQQGSICPNLEKSNILKAAFNITQKLLKKNYLLSGHDISDGGLIVCLAEMAISGLCGLRVDLSNVLMKVETNIHMEGLTKVHVALVLLYAEECGWILEIENEHLSEVLTAFQDGGVPVHHIGKSKGNGLNSSFDIVNGEKCIIKTSTINLLKQWESTSFELEKLQSNPECAIEEFDSYNYRIGPSYNCTFDPNKEFLPKEISAPVRVAVLREEGINSDREMMASLARAQFEVHDVSMYDLLNKKTTLDKYRGIIFPGGFSYADTLGSAKGWAANIMYSDVLSAQFQHFKNRKETFSLGICNGCQLMSLIGWVGTSKDERVVNIPDVALLTNRSGRFECRWSTVKIEKSNAIMLRKMTGSVLGCWVAHGEGRFSFKTETILKSLKDNNCITLRYVDDSGQPTEKYPMNPNGSIAGIAGLCSTDGRHLALMPHPERCALIWQWPYLPSDFTPKRSPWQAMFDEAHVWCLENN